jgi:hypothetical protein
MYIATSFASEYVPAFIIQKTENMTVARSAGEWKVSSSYACYQQPSITDFDVAYIYQCSAIEG